ncbi:TerD family protein [Suttonella ornithocola]|uniref:Stress response protein SCP2 n=1 Tax=Suttonella ornithocola TaxID=279832 RepID=A0A380MP34_9GAMM|nr:TerD family protein [Suttonella ornithocola]SUO94379.1 Stress response protein SCP2 [Suttonella ornithocola]
MSVNLTKGQKISLAKPDGSALKKVVMGLGWDAVKKKGIFGMFSGNQEIDLDASCLLFDENKQPVDVVFFNHLKSEDGSITHTGDNRTGDGDGDDEQIIVDLERVPASVKALVFTVNNYTGQDFSQVENAFCRLVDQSNNQEIARYNLSAQGNHNAQIMAKVYRYNGKWKMHASGRTFEQLIPAIIPHL